ncbi:MAG: ribulose-phosphate 3-epimerase, partial [Candidatus Gracilibacteria bacterium]|nr:ribulose-phosphate 3-epimerase [Candidatus Gracilibacteria bacterium]
MDIKISASILSADFGKLNEEIKSVEKYVDEIHIDVMDGHFVPNLTFGQVVLKDLKTSLRKNCHLMVDNPEILLKPFADAGADHVTVHYEVFDNKDDLLRIIAEIHSLGMTAGVSIRPKTDVAKIESLLDKVEEVLVMSVEPGFGGQSFMENSLAKIKRI